MKIVSTVEARIGSSRLPGKTLMKILGRPMLELLLERLKRSKLIDEIVIATTTNPKDEIIAELAKKTGVKCFRGSEEDVLARVLDAAKSVNADIIVEITADCPLIDPDVVDMTIREYLNNDYDYVCNVNAPERTPVLNSNFPSGLETQVFSVKVLEEVSRLTDDPSDREHVSIYIYMHPDEFKVFCIKAPEELNYPKLWLSVEYKEDFEVIKKIYESLYLKNPEFSFLDVIEFLKNDPVLKLRLEGKK